jgi:hypothetical protein
VRGPNGAAEALPVFGAPHLGDLPVPSDYDGVGHVEQAVYRPSNASWYVREPNGTTKTLATFGWANVHDVPVQTSVESLVQLGVVGPGIHLSSMAAADSVAPASTPAALTSIPTPPIALRVSSASSRPSTATQSSKIPSGPRVLGVALPSTIRLRKNHKATLDA